MKLAAALLLSLFLVVPAFAMDPPPLEKADAKRILESMDWREVTVIAIRQGVDNKGVAAPIYATIIGLGTFCGEHRPICETLHYDKELDWYFLELGRKSARLWNKEGYREIKPWTTW